MRKIVFVKLFSPRELFSDVFAHLCLLFFFYAPLFLENHPIALHQFFCGRFWYQSESISLKSSFHSVSPSAGSHFEVFWGLLDYVLVFFKSCFILSYKILYSRCLYYSDSQWAKKKLTAFISLLGDILQFFGLFVLGFFGMLWVCSIMSWER